MLKLHFKTLTPLFIGSGDVLERDFHYKIDDVDFRKYNESRLVADLASKNVIDFNREQSAENLKQRIIEGNYSDDKFFDYTVGMAQSFYSYITGHETPGKDSVQEFINENGKFYIPGSSVKGALCTTLGFDKLGIIDSIAEKFVIQDCVDLSYDDFLVFHFDRPPYVNLLALQNGIQFTTVIPESNGINKKLIEERVGTYFKNQISKSIAELKNYKEKNNREDFPILELFENLKTNHSNDVIINLGFGGGSWFKISKGEIPKFQKENADEPEIPTTTYHYTNKSGNLVHIGWCKMEVEEC
jgi:CRISPR/Cas system CSM-associated protein Csm5 (group 7 of RAMP superfamily)